MKKFYQFQLLCIVTLFAFGCSSGHKAYKHGDYYKACMEAIERLRSNPGNEKSQYVLTNSYPLAQKDAEREIANAKLANGTDQYDVLVFQYERMNQLANAIYHSPKANQLIPHPKEYIAELSSAKQMAADQAYAMGIKAVEANTIDQARIGFQYFTKANEYVPGYKDVIQKIEEARYYATIRVIVQPPYTSNKYQYTADFFYNNLFAEMVRTSRNRFVRFYTPEEAAKENMRDAHQFIILNFEDFSIGNIRETSNSVEVSRDSVIVGTVEVQGKKYNTYNTVKAKLTTIRQEISSGGVLSLRIVDAQNNRELQLRNFTGQYIWATEWATFQGDDRALTNEEKKKCQKQREVPPSQQDMFIQFTKPIYDQTIPYLRNFYSRY